MQVLHHPESGLVPPSGTAVTIGAYDGVHRGHQAVIARVRELAGPAGSGRVVVTFDRHPARVVRPESAPELLCDLTRSSSCWPTPASIDHSSSTSTRSGPGRPADDFVREVLVRVPRRPPRGGRRGLPLRPPPPGNVALLEEMGAELEFEVVGHDLVGACRPGNRWPARLGTRSRPRPSGGRWSQGRPTTPRCSVVPTRSAVRSSTATSGAAPRVPHRQRGHARDPPAPPTGSTPVVGPPRGGGTLRLRLPRPPPTFYEQPASLLEVHCSTSEGDLYGEEVRVHFDGAGCGPRKFDTIEALGRSWPSTARGARASRVIPFLGGASTGARHEPCRRT